MPAKATRRASNEIAGSATSNSAPSWSSSRIRPFASRTRSRPPVATVRPTGPSPGTMRGSPGTGARETLEERLIACANLLPGARSLYRWKGALQDEREVVALMKTRKQDWAAMMSRLHELHPYETPECVAVRIAAGAPRYMAWLEES